MRRCGRFEQEWGALGYSPFRFVTEGRSVDLTTIDLGRSSWSRLGRKLTRAERVSFAFAISGDTGAPASSVAFAEIAPGRRHPDAVGYANPSGVRRGARLRRVGSPGVW